MEPIKLVRGGVSVLDRADVDTDQIMPKQFLKRIDRTGFDECLFHDWRAEDDFVLNRPEHQDATVLVAGPNFGCGSSREHAPWGLQQWGFEAIVAPSFADIFRSNCAKIGLLTVTLAPETCRRLLDTAAGEPRTQCRIDLPGQRLTAGDVDVSFDIDPHTKWLLTHGLDDIGLTLRDETAISEFEERRPTFLPVASLP